MKKFAVCPHCGQKLLKAEPGSSIEMMCPGCKQLVEVIVEQSAVTLKDKEKSAAGGNA